VKAQSLEAVYRYHMNDLYRYLLLLSDHPQTAEDLVQDTFVKAYEHLESYRGEKVRPWLFRVARNAYIDWYRRERRQVQTDPGRFAGLTGGAAPGAEEEYLRREELRNWFRAVSLLPEKSRQAVLLREYHGFTYEEIAQVLGLSLTNVKVTLFRARQKIREVLRSGMP